MKTIAYHFTGTHLRDGRPVPPVNEWLEHDGPVVPCQSGLHASPHPFDALKYAPGNMLHKVELDGTVVPHDNDKLAASRRRIIASIDATELLRKFARQQALSVIHLWSPPQVVLDYLNTGDESLRSSARAATYAVYADADATCVAARAAANAARAATSAVYADADATHAAACVAYYAARAAARDAANAARDAANAVYADADATHAATYDAYYAARAAARDAARDEFKRLVDEAFND